MEKLITSILILVGSFLMLTAAIGLLRMPDTFTRMHVVAKAGVLGVLTLFGAVAVYFAHIDITARSAAAIFFLFLTAPVGAHIIGRAAYRWGTPLWDKTRVDELGEYLSETLKDTHDLRNDK
jgi:multicomponent Na+:H+ antiporter subunit G